MTGARRRPNVFISYRRTDSHAHAGRLFDFLTTRLGKEHVFMDIDSIPAGRDFFDVISETIAKTDALVVLIGPNWSSASDERGQRRLDNPQDYVRREIEAALVRGARIIPVLVDGAVMPPEQALPDGIKPLVAINALPLPERGWVVAANELLVALGGGRTRGYSQQPRRRLAVVVGGVLLALLIAGGAAMVVHDDAGAHEGTGTASSTVPQRSSTTRATTAPPGTTSTVTTGTSTTGPANQPAATSGPGVTVPPPYPPPPGSTSTTTTTTTTTTTAPPVKPQTITVDTTELSQLSGEEIPYVFLRKRPYKSDNRNYFPTGCDDQDPVDGCRRAAPGDVYPVECIVRGEQDWPTGQGLWKYAKVRVGSADPVTHQTYAYIPQAAYKPDLPVSDACPAS